MPSFSRLPVALASVTLLPFLVSQTRPGTPGHLHDAFAAGWMLVDTNGDEIIDAVNGKVVVPTEPSEAENTAAAEFAARIGFASTGITPPLVISAPEDHDSGPRIWVGAASAPSKYKVEIANLLNQLQQNEGGVFELQGNLVVLGQNDAGLLAAAEGYAAHAPYIWKVPGEKLQAIAAGLNTMREKTSATLLGLTYRRGVNGVNRAILRTEVQVPVETLETALKSARFDQVHQLSVITNGAPGVTFASDKPLPVSSPPLPASAGAPDAEAATPPKLDLATLYTMRGLFRGTPKMPIPSNLDSQLYVPSGKAGIEMANLAARMGMETTGITLPLAKQAGEVGVKDVRTKSVIAGDNSLSKEALSRLLLEAPAAAGDLAAGEGELRIVDKAFGKHGAVLARGDDAGSAAALRLLSGHFPNLWETGKQFGSLEEIRYDLHRFFSLRSGVGQASVALYRLNEWIGLIAQSDRPIRDVEASVYTDITDPRLQEFIRTQLVSKLGTLTAKVDAQSLHAGIKCCDHNPSLHYREPGRDFHQAAPTFEENIVIPWEGNTLVSAVERALPAVRQGQPARLRAMVSEGPEQRLKLAKKLTDMLLKQGADPKQTSVVVLSSYKPGFSWLMDDVTPRLKGKRAASLKIEFKRNEDLTGMRSMFSPARWVHELYPVDELLARELQVPLEKITLEMFTGTANDPTYRVHVLDASGTEILADQFTVKTVNRPYSGTLPLYEQIQVDTGWVRLESGTSVVLDERIKTDIEGFWDHYQDQTLPKLYSAIMSQSHGELRPEFAPPFDTLLIDVQMSEPDYNLGIDKERISSLEALQEDTFYSTENFVNMIGDLEASRAVGYAGRIIPVVHASRDGQDGQVRIRYFAKPAPNPSVSLKWTDAHGERHELKRDLFVLSGAMQPRLVAARVKAGQSGPNALTWLLPADFADDSMEEWSKLEGREMLERTIFPVAQAKGQLHWLEAMHKAGLYKDDLSYPHLERVNLEFELPVPLTQKAESPAPRELASFSVVPPATARPMIANFAKPIKGNSLVQWDEPIAPAENAAILAKFATFPGVNVYWMGRSYLGENLWAADVMLPSPSQLHSWPKETTVKASVIYSGRQHANEVSSTSHILKLGEQLLTDPHTRATLKQVNVVLHPITNADGAELSVQLAEITPNNMLHPGYHGALAADVAAGQQETDPIYPESRTRKQLLDSWLPDTFLNPHGYPSHEWVQPFSEYSGWVQSRQGANVGRTWWIPRGWFTSLNFLRDSEHPFSPKIAYEIRDRIVEAERKVPGLLDLENRMNARYERFGQKWQPRNMQQPIVNGIRIYMSLKGMPGVAPGEGAGRGNGGLTGISPDITWNSGYTEAPDETAHGDYMKLMASAGLAFDRVHLFYLANGKLRVRRTERETAGKVTWRVERLRPNLPATETEPPLPEPQSSDVSGTRPPI